MGYHYCKVLAHYNQPQSANQYWPWNIKAYYSYSSAL